MATNLDGYIAGPNGEFDWIVSDPDIDFAALFAQFDTAVMGRKTFLATLQQGGNGAMPGLDVVVFSRTLRPDDYPAVSVVNRDPAESVRSLKGKPGKDIWLFGGGELVRTLLEAGLDQRQRTVVSKLDRGYDDYVSGKISEEFWTRKSQEWEGELLAVDVERARIDQPRAPVMATATQILELAKQAEFLYNTQDPAKQRRLLETVLSNCTFDRGTLCPTYSKPFDLLVRGNETGEWRGRRDSNPRPPA